MFAKRHVTRAIAGIAAVCLFLGVGCGPPESGGSDDDEESGGGQDTSVNPFDTGTSDDTSTPGGEDTSTPGDEDTGTTPGDDDTGGMEEDTQDFACTFFPDSCPDGQNCYPGQTGRQCRDYTSGKSPGDSCSANMPTSCGDEQLCDQDGSCRNRCDPNAAASDNGCNQGDACLPLGDGQGNALPIGICQPGCEQFPSDSCPDGENCYATEGGGTTCAAYSQSASAGDPCSSPTDCGNNQICVNTQSGDSVCANKCTQDGQGPCTGEDCQMLQGLDHGVCPLSN